MVVHHKVQYRVLLHQFCDKFKGYVWELMFVLIYE